MSPVSPVVPTLVGHRIQTNIFELDDVFDYHVNPVASYRARLRVHVPGTEDRGGYRGIIVPGINFGHITAFNVEMLRLS